METCQTNFYFEIEHENMSLILGTHFSSNNMEQNLFLIPRFLGFKKNLDLLFH